METGKYQFKQEKQYKGTTKWMQSAIFESNTNLKIDKAYLEIKNAMDNCLIGDLI